MYIWIYYHLVAHHVFSSFNCPLYKINHFGLTPGGFFLLLLAAYRPHGLRIRCPEWDIPRGSFSTVSCGCIKSRGQSRAAQHLFGIYASLVAPRVDLCRPPTVPTTNPSQLVYVCHAPHTRSWISNACTAHSSPTQRHTSSQVHSCHCWLAPYRSRRWCLPLQLKLVMTAVKVKKKSTSPQLDDPELWRLPRKREDEKLVEYLVEI